MDFWPKAGGRTRHYPCIPTHWGCETAVFTAFELSPSRVTVHVRSTQQCLPLPSKGGACTGGVSPDLSARYCADALTAAAGHTGTLTHTAARGRRMRCRPRVAVRKGSRVGMRGGEACLIGIKAQKRRKRGDQDRSARVARGVSFASPDIRQAVLVSSFITYPRDRRFSHAGGGGERFGLSLTSSTLDSVNAAGGVFTCFIIRPHCSGTLRGSGVLCVSLLWQSRGKVYPATVRPIRGGRVLQLEGTSPPSSTP